MRAKSLSNAPLQERTENSRAAMSHRHGRAALSQPTHQPIRMTESVTLYFREGPSDKVYQASLEAMPDDPDFYEVRFAYGRRGSPLATGSKTPVPVNRAEARKIYDRLIREKTAKGYTPGADGTPYGGKSEIRNPKSETPNRLLPQLLNAVDEAELERLIASREWWMQAKHDGRRMLLVADENGVTAFNKLGKPCGGSADITCATPLAPFVTGAARGRCVLDGEAVGDTFHAFDLLESGGRDLRGLPYAERHHDLLHLLGPPDAPVHPGLRVTPTHQRPGAKRLFLAALRARNAEGAVFKDPTAPYTPGRPNSGGPQRKFKFVATASCLVVGHNRKASVMLALIDDDSTFGAQVGVGSVTIPPNQPVPAPGAVVEVRYLYAYRGGALYQPVCLGERTDTEPAECVLSQLKYKAD